MSNGADIAKGERQPAVRLRRSALFVPAVNEKALAKIAALDADAVILDLEDSVAPEAKGEARERLRAFLRGRAPDGKEIAVRVNALDSPWGTEDLLAARGAGVDAILLPKVETAADIETAAEALDQTDAPAGMRLWAMIETAAGILAVERIAALGARKDSRLGCLVVGPNDIARETGVGPAAGRPYLVPWLMRIVLSARAFGLDALDGVYNDFRDADGLRDECAQGRAMGFSGKTLIHPAQINAANEAFGVGPAELEEARAIVAAFAAPGNAGKGVLQIDGRMVERLHLHEAERLIASAEAAARPEKNAPEDDAS